MRWYTPFLCYGRAENILQEISRVIRENDFGQYVPRICFERKPGRQFYLFMAIESDSKGQLPPALDSLLQLRCLAHPVEHRRGMYAALTRDEIKGMVSSEIDVQDYARTLRWVVKHEEMEDPFALTSAAQAVEKRDQSQSYRKMLFWLSAMGGATYAVFRVGCQSLGLVDTVTPPSRVLRRFRLLGHVECSPDGHHWSVAPPVLTRTLGSKVAPHVLCGARDSILISALGRFAALSEKSQPNGDGPPIVSGYFDESQLSDLAAELGATHGLRVASAAIKLTEALPPLDGWAERLARIEGIVPTTFQLRIHDGKTFRDTVFEGASGLYDLRRDDGRKLQLALYFDSRLGRWLKGDWYGLRFLSLQSQRSLRSVIYDSNNRKLAIQQSERWPEIYERSLVLCSGQLPVRNHDWLIYENVSEDIALRLTEKLSLTMDRK